MRLTFDTLLSLCTKKASNLVNRSSNIEELEVTNQAPIIESEEIAEQEFDDDEPYEIVDGENIEVNEETTPENQSDVQETNTSFIDEINARDRLEEALSASPIITFNNGQAHRVTANDIITSNLPEQSEDVNPENAETTPSTEIDNETTEEVASEATPADASGAEDVIDSLEMTDEELARLSDDSEDNLTNLNDEELTTEQVFEQVDEEQLADEEALKIQAQEEAEATVEENGGTKKRRKSKYPDNYPDELKKYKCRGNDADLACFFKLAGGNQEYSARTATQEVLDGDIEKCRRFVSNSFNLHHLPEYLSFGGDIEEGYSYQGKYLNQRTKCYYISPDDLSVWENRVRVASVKKKNTYWVEHRLTVTLEYRIWQKYEGGPSPFSFYRFAQTRDEVMALLEEKKPYAAKFCKEYEVDPREYCLWPEMELYFKTGFKFIKDFYTTDNPNCGRSHKRWWSSHGGYSEPRTKLAEIIDLETVGGSLFKKFKSLSPEWVKVLLKNEQTSFENIERANMFSRAGVSISQGLEISTLIGETGRASIDKNRISQFLALYRKQDPEGKQYFTFKSLTSTLRRLDQYEAYEPYEAIIELDDYIRMCEITGNKPKFDTNSLRREHAVMIRNYREFEALHADELKKTLFEEAAKWTKKLDFADEKYFLRGVRNPDDLNEEALNMHNCVATYIKKICNKETYILFMRDKEHPQTSLITVEINPTTGNVVQAFLAFNRSIIDPEQLAFVEKIHEHAQAIILKGEKPMVLPEKLDYGYDPLKAEKEKAQANAIAEAEALNPNEEGVTDGTPNL